ncbi:MAG TPA: DUF2461 domain-containing protein [Chitinophagaceae bacterium]|nr:DUF2461 domain-containing protein [Chitinophagaceae bacterium]
MTVLPFLKKLQKNNNKPWFDENRALYIDAKTEFESFVESLIAAFGKHDPTVAHLLPKDCIFRINRDVRFSKDKSPYKTNFGAFINSGGKKSPLAGYYVHIEPGGSFVGGGLYMPMPDMLSKVRQEIDYNLPEFKSIINGAAFKKQYKELHRGEDISLTRVPKGYEPANPAAEYLKLKSFIAMRPLSDEEVQSGDLEKICVTAFKALKPLVDFVNRTAE